MSVLNMESNASHTYQSVACQSIRSDAAKIASALAGEKLPMASCRPRSAMEPWWICRFRVSDEDCVQARWFAENDSSACMTYGYEDAMLKNLEAEFVSEMKSTVEYEDA